MSILTPSAVHVEDQKLQLTWMDGKIQNLSAYALRCACPCASCVSEISGERTLDISRISTDLKFTKAYPTGNYAISIEFSDFHKTGIFTYEYLRELAAN